MSSPNEKVFQVRDKNRAEMRLFHLEQRRDSLDRRRIGVEVERNSSAENNKQFTDMDLKKLVARIKRKKNADEGDLRKLCAAFLQSSELISMFCSITGALNVLVKVLTGTDDDQQVLAAECLCNLTLGEEACTKKVASAAGTYIILYLQNPNLKLQETCLWTIQNIILSGPKCLQILLSQGLSEQLLATNDIESVAILVHSAFNVLPEPLQKQLPAFCCLHYHTDLGFRALYECLLGLDFEADPAVLDGALQQATQFLINASPDNFSRWILSIRVFTNIMSKHHFLFASVIAILLEKKTQLSAVVQKILDTNNETIVREGLWLAGTLQKLVEDERDLDLCRYFSEVDLLEQNLKVPVSVLA